MYVECREARRNSSTPPGGNGFRQVADGHGQHAGERDENQCGDAEHQRTLAVQRGTDDRGHTEAAYQNRVGKPDVVGADALVQSGFGLGVGGASRPAAALRGGLGRRHSGFGLRLRHNLGA